MNLNNPQAMGIPRQNPAFPMAQLRDNPSGGLYNYNQPTEVIGGYDAKINPMTGQEIPQVNFAGGGLASLLESKGRRGDTMLVHMAPEEVRGLQALALAHGGTLTVNPETGLYEASFLKKLLPTIIGAIVPSVPGLGTLAKTIGFGNTALGTSLLVGGASALIEGDLKKGLEAGLGAYSGANISESLRAASVAAAPGTVAPEEMAKYQRSLGDAAAKKELMGLTDTAPLQSSQGISSVPYRPIDLGARLKDQITSRMPSLGNAAGLANLGPIDTGPVAPAAQPSIMGGIKGLFTSPEARTAFGEALGGGFKSPFMQQMAKTATFSGIANALSPEPKPLPTGGAMGEDFIYVPGGFNPLYGTGRDQPYQLPGKYYKRTPQGLVPFNPFALAPGVRGFADGGIVDPARDPGGNILLPPPPKTPFSPYFTNPVTDPNVAATRSYIEELNRRARTPEVVAYPGVSGGLGGFNVPFTPPVDTGGGGVGGDVGGGGGSLTGSPVGDLAVSMIGQHYINKGIDAGIGYLRDKFFPTEEQQLQRDAAEEQARRDAEAKQMQKDVAAEVQANPNLLGPAAIAGLPSLVPPPAPAGTVEVGNLAAVDDPAAQAQLDAERQAAQREIDARRAARTSPSSVSPAGIASVAPAIASSVASVLPSAGGVALDAAGNVVVYGSKAANAAAAAAYSKAIDAGADAATAAAAGEKAAAAATPSTLTSKIIPGAQAALGLYDTFKGIEAGKSGQAALGAASAAYGLSQFPAFAALGGPLGMLGAAALAALAATLTTTEEMGADDLKAYWKGVEQAGKNNATYFGQSDPNVLTRGFINLFRTNKFEFPGQEKYGRTGNDDFLRDMTSVINDAVSSGQVGKDADAITIYSSVVRPWLASMGPGTKDAETQSVIDYMMTDLINNYMYGRPISPSQMKQDKSQVSSYKMVDAGFSPYAGAPKALGNLAFFDQLISSPEALYASDPRMGAGRAARDAQLAGTAPTTPFSEPQAVAPPPTPDAIRVQEILANTRSPIDAYREIFNSPAPTPFSAPRIVEETAPTPYSPRIIEEEPAPSAALRKTIPTPISVRPDSEAPVPYMPSIREEEPVLAMPPPAPKFSMADLGLEPEREYIPTPFSEPEVIREPEPVYIPPVYREPEPVYRREYEMFSPFSEFGEGQELQFNYGGAVGEDYNFGFARGGMPNEYQAGGKLLDGPGDGMSDDIPAVIRGKGVQRAALADGEFVIPADVVSHLGNGSTKAGAKKLYDMMARVRQARTGRTKQAPAVKTTRLLPA